MPELLTDRALKWFIANNKVWETWVEFIQSFQEFLLPRGFMTKLEDQDFPGENHTRCGGVLCRTRHKQEPADKFLLDLRENRSKDCGMLPQIGKRHAIPDSEGQPGFASCSPSKLMGKLKAEERQLSATVLIDGVEIKPTMDTGATASFISEELADKLQTAGEVLPTRREV
ncbi:GD10577 [Drosophila simulans]|uniref:GD10577 n=1 Tax=Drosophila simulans TaxID=7240 RepID=B4NV72_DROSI|nr:GD10577 [Drosophila simulans]